jgi:hypothetical protein
LGVHEVDNSLYIQLVKGALHRTCGSATVRGGSPLFNKQGVVVEAATVDQQLFVAWIDPAITVLIPPFFAKAREGFVQERILTVSTYQDPSRGSLVGLNVDDEAREPQKDEGGGHRFNQHLVRSSHHSQGFGIKMTGV